jgi:hypothetical protein
VSYATFAEHAANRGYRNRVSAYREACENDAYQLGAALARFDPSDESPFFAAEYATPLEIAAEVVSDWHPDLEDSSECYYLDKIVDAYERGFFDVRNES